MNKEKTEIYYQKYQDLYNSYFILHKDLIDRYGWKITDSRLAPISMISNFFNTQRLQYQIVYTTLDEVRWWQIFGQSLDPEINDGKIERYRKNYDVITNVALFQYSITLVELWMTNIYTILFYSEPPVNFSLTNKYERVLSEMEKKEHSDFFEFIVFLRNLNHTGKHIKNNKDFKFRGGTYSFIKGQEIDSLSPELIIEIYEEFLLIVKDILSSDRIISSTAVQSEYPLIDRS